MKTKLLKKIRKRFSWVWNPKYKRYDVIDKNKQQAFFIDNDYVKKILKESKPLCGRREAKYRLLRCFIYSPFLVNPMGKIMYRGLRSNIIKRLRKLESRGV